MNRSENGNALFLILIAVALFAALSYAITSSGRGGGDITKEQAQIKAAQISGAIAYLESNINRLYLLGGYDQVRFNDSAESTSGTCYNGGQPTTPCHTIGLFNSETGVTYPGGLDDYRVWMFYMRLTLGAADVGTNAGDIFIGVSGLDDQTCQSLNDANDVTGAFTTVTFTSPGGPGRASEEADKYGNYTLDTNPGDFYTSLASEPICAYHNDGITLRYYYVFQRN